MTVLWLKALHIIFMVTWFAGLFYLPRLFVYHAMTVRKLNNEEHHFEGPTPSITITHIEKYFFNCFFYNFDVVLLFDVILR